MKRLLVLLFVLFGAIGTALAQEPEPAPAAEPAPAPSASASAAPPASAAAPAQPPSSSWTVDERALGSGRSALPNDAKVPVELLPPGAFADDSGPSVAIFPPQAITLRFNHKFHVGTQHLKCITCHKKAETSHSAHDALLPVPTTCDACHGTDHSNLDRVTPGDDMSGKCNFCHVGYKDGDGNTVAKVSIPRPNMIFDHAKHLARNIACQQCHGDVEQLELATRDQLPRMRGCLGCHQKTDAASQGDAKSTCENCHIKAFASQTTAGGRIQTVFASGTMQPPRWLHNAWHGPDFVQRHKYVAANDSQFCANCHKEDFCTDCHDGRVRPRNIHPNDYLAMHPVEARLATQRCTSCHREQSFCVQCHQRLGVAMSGPAGTRDSGRFHPPKSEWSDAPRRPGHHSFEAMRNLNACVSCHVERDCVVCHGGQGIGGGFNPHSGGFAAGCKTQFKRNPRPCYVCHEPGARQIAECR